jgi:hypothetical protein
MFPRGLPRLFVDRYPFDWLLACRLLAEKTEPRFACQPLDQFLYDRASGAKLMRLPWMKERFQRLASRSAERMGKAVEASKTAQVAAAHASRAPEPGAKP